MSGRQLIQKQGIDGRPVSPWKCTQCEQEIGAGTFGPCACTTTEDLACDIGNHGRERTPLFDACEAEWRRRFGRDASTALLFAPVYVRERLERDLAARVAAGAKFVGAR
jgi:hypothetical protein